VIFWDNCESHLPSKGLFAGRYIPSFPDEYTGCHTHERLHTSFLIINNPRKLVEKTMEFLKGKFEAKLVEPVMYLEEGGRWKRFDTFAMAYQVFKEEAESFGPEFLDRYDHLFCGTHLRQVQEHHPYLVPIHEEIKQGNIRAAKGLWRRQEEYFKSL